jgi:hypothetical protein
MSNYIVGGGKICLSVPEEYVPRFSAGIHDFRAISVEVGQGTNDDAYDPRDIDLVHELVSELSSKYKFTTNRIAYVDGNNYGWPGLVGHEDTAQGRGQGKSDPGHLFWEAYLGADDVTPEQAKKIEEAWKALCGGDSAAMDAWNSMGNSMIAGYTGEQVEQDSILERVRRLEATGLPAAQINSIIDEIVKRLKNG